MRSVREKPTTVNSHLRRESRCWLATLPGPRQGRELRLIEQQIGPAKSPIKPWLDLFESCLVSMEAFRTAVNASPLTNLVHGREDSSGTG